MDFGDKYEKNAAYTVVDPPEDVQGIKDYIGFKWNQIDAWFEEEEEIFIHLTHHKKYNGVLQSLYSSMSS